MICPSGTSAVTGLASVKALLSSTMTPTDQQIKDAVLEPPPQDSRDYNERIAAIEIMKAPSEKIFANNANFGASERFPSAELQTILRWLRGSPDVDELRVILLPSKDSKSILTAKVTAVCLQILKPLFPKVKFSDSEIIPLSIEVDTREKFLSSIANLYRELDILIANINPREEVIICSTGGYKAISGFVMVYAQLHSLPCLYSFETSPAYEVMNMPLGYAYSMLDEEINMLKAVNRNTDINKAALPQWVKDSELFAGTFIKSYEHAREKPYGTGEELFRRLRKCKNGNEWADYLKELLINKWSELWQGDQIPETVEHSRRHSKRLMEIAANLFRCAGDDKISRIGFTDEAPKPLALLIASIYLHDIGHTALSYPVIYNRKDIYNENLFPLGLFPSAVRELHHLLTGALLTASPEKYFMSDKYSDKAKLFEECIPLIAAHHRGYTSLKGEAAKLDKDNRIAKAGNLLLGSEKFLETLRPLEERASGLNISVDILLNVTALLRVLDGCDVQADRVISENYLDYRNQRSQDEARLIYAELLSCIKRLPLNLQEEAGHLLHDLPENEIKGSCKRIYSKVFDSLGNLKEKYKTWRNVQSKALPEFTALSLINNLAFKLEQHIHFKKHQCVSFVLPVMDHDRDVISIQLFTDDKNSDTINEIINNINDEYKAVKNILINFPAFEARC